MSIVNEALICAVRNRLLQDCRIGTLAIDVGCADGYVHLSGMVDTPEQKLLAVQLVSGMIGVRNVRDELSVRAPDIFGQRRIRSDGWPRV